MIVCEERGLRIVNPIAEAAVMTRVSTPAQQWYRSLLLASLADSEIDIARSEAGSIALQQVRAAGRALAAGGDLIDVDTAFVHAVAERLLPTEPALADKIAQQWPHDATLGSVAVAASALVGEPSVWPRDHRATPQSVRHWLSLWRLRDEPPPSDLVAQLVDSCRSDDFDERVAEELAAVHSRTSPLTSASHRVRTAERAARSVAHRTPFEVVVDELELAERCVANGSPDSATAHLDRAAAFGLGGLFATRHHQLIATCHILRGHTPGATHDDPLFGRLHRHLLSRRHVDGEERCARWDVEHWVPEPWQDFSRGLAPSDSGPALSDRPWWSHASRTNVAQRIERALDTGFVEAAIHLALQAQRTSWPLPPACRDRLRTAVSGTWAATMFARGPYQDAKATEEVAPDVNSFWSLHPFDREIALLVAAGHSNAAAGATLGISLHAVSNRLKRIYRHIGVHSRLELSQALRDVRGRALIATAV